MCDVSTLDWGAVSVTTLDTMNEIINADSTFPKKMDFVKEIAGMSVVLNGVLGDFVISNNVSGPIINMQFSIADGTISNSVMTLNLDNGKKESYVEVEVLLKGIHSDPNKWNKSEDEVIDNTKCDELKADDRSPVVIVDYVFTGEGMNKESWDTVAAVMIGDWFKQNITKFDSIFSVIILGLKTEKTEIAWLYPSAYTYAANSTISGTSGGFAGLTLVDGETNISELQQVVDISALNLVKSHDANLALIISKKKFVKHILLQCAIDLIKSSTEADFTLSDTELSFSNNREIIWQNFEDEDGNKADPHIPAGGFKITLSSGYILLSITGAHYRPRPNTTVTMSVIQRFSFKVDKNDKGEPIFVPDEEGLGDAEIFCEAKLDDWLTELQFITMVILSITSLLSLGTTLVDAIGAEAVEGMVAIEGASSVTWTFKIFGRTIELDKLAPLAELIFNGVNSWPTLYNVVKIGSRIIAGICGVVYGSISIADVIYLKKYDHMPSFEHIANAFISSDLWPTLENVELKSATIANSFVIGLKMS